MIRILVTAPLLPETVDHLNAIPEFEVSFQPGLTAERLEAEVRGVEALVCADIRALTRKVLAAASELRLVVLCGGAAAAPAGAARRGVEVRRSDGGLSTIALLKDFFNA